MYLWQSAASIEYERWEFSKSRIGVAWYLKQERSNENNYFNPSFRNKQIWERSKIHIQHSEITSLMGITSEPGDSGSLGLISLFHGTMVNSTV